MAVSGMLRSVGRSFTGQQAGTGDCPGLGRPDQIYSCNCIKKSDFIFSKGIANRFSQKIGQHSAIIRSIAPVSR